MGATAWAVGSAFAFSLEGLLAHLAIGGGASLLGAIAARYVLAAALAWAALSVTGGLRRLARRDEGVLAAAGALGYGATTALLFLAFVRIPTSLAIVLLYTYPVLVAAGAHVLGRERLTGPLTVAGGVAVLGVVLASAPAGGEVGGALLALGAAATNAVTILVTEPVLARVSALAGTARLALAAAVSTAVAAAVAGQALVPPRAALPGVAGLALLPTLAAVLLLNRSLQAVGATRTAVISTLEPVFAAVWGVALLHEHLAGLQWAGAALTVAGATAVSVLPRPSRPASTP